MKKATAEQLLLTTSTGTYNAVCREFLKPIQAPCGFTRNPPAIHHYVLDRNTDSPLKPLVQLLDSGDRGYMKDKVSGNFLEDFLRVHGEESITVYPKTEWGNAREAGRGFYFVE